jgi:uncharacterized delta-60 repeat protein
VTPLFTLHSYEFGRYRADAPGPMSDVGAEIFAYSELDEGFLVGTAEFAEQPPYPDELDIDQLPDGIVNASADGKEYFAITEAPGHAPTLTHDDIVGGVSIFTQYQGFRRNAERATVTATISRVHLEITDGNPGDPTPEECRDLYGIEPGFPTKHCLDTIVSFATLDLIIQDRDNNVLWHQEGNVGLSGFFQNYVKYGFERYPVPMFMTRDDFELVEGGPTHAEMDLKQPITVRISVPTSIPIGGEFELVTELRAHAYNRKQRESETGIFFRDPQGIGGIATTYEGVEPIEAWPTPPVILAAAAVPVCSSGVDPEAGTIQWASANSAMLERQRGRLPIYRTGGKRGALSVRVRFTPGSAVPGSDYDAVDQLVTFADGSDLPRFVELGIIDNAIEQPTRTFTARLEDLRGCGSLGDPQVAVIGIVDDDAPPATSYSVGGTVTGLVGSGLQLHDRIEFADESIAANGSYAFDNLRLAGTSYDIRIVSQPSNPIQICTLYNGLGTLATANVTNVNVSCATPAPSGSLDPGFGDQGRVVGDRAGNALALQPDGKMVVALRSAGQAWLTRYLADGTLDAAFGSNGLVREELGYTDDELNQVAIQSDGKILASGYALNRASGNQDFLLKRYLADGSPDLSFGDQGTVWTAFVANAADRSRALLVLADGKILLAGGEGHVGSTPGSQTGSLTVARYLADGSPDDSFGTNGQQRVLLAGYMPEATKILLQADGKLVLAGRARTSGSGYYDIVMARLHADGAVDSAYGTNGIQRTRINTFDDYVTDAVMQSDGKVLATLYTWTGSGLGATLDFGLARFTDTGVLDTTFNGAGYLTTALGSGDDTARFLELLPDGKLLVAGASVQGAASDFALVRFNADGTRDAGFGSNGVVFTDFFGGIDAVEAGLVIQPDGKYLLGGTAVNGSSAKLALVRVLP